MPREQYEILWKDYYQLLGIRTDAGPETIERMFRRLSQLYHPDVAGSVAVDPERMKELNEAKEVLSDPDRRARYDQVYRSRSREHSRQAEDTESQRRKEEERLRREASERLRREEAERRRRAEEERIRRETEARRQREEEERLRREAAERLREEAEMRRVTARTRKGAAIIIAISTLVIGGLYLGSYLWESSQSTTTVPAVATGEATTEPLVPTGEELTSAPNPALAQEDTIDGNWQFDFDVYRVLKSDGSTSVVPGYPPPRYTIVADLSQVENGFTGSTIGTSDGVCTDVEISGTIQGNQVNWVLHHNGWCCQDAETVFEGTLSQDGKTMTGTLSPLKPSSSTFDSCELWWAKVTATYGKPTIALDPPEGPPGSNLTVRGSGWRDGDTVILFMDPAGWGPSRDPTGWGSGNEVARVTTDDAGNFEYTFSVPSHVEEEQEVTAIVHPTYGIWMTTALFQVAK